MSVTISWIIVVFTFAALAFKFGLNGDDPNSTLQLGNALVLSCPAAGGRYWIKCDEGQTEHPMKLLFENKNLSGCPAFIEIEDHYIGGDCVPVSRSKNGIQSGVAITAVTQPTSCSTNITFPDATRKFRITTAACSIPPTVTTTTYINNPGIIDANDVILTTFSYSGTTGIPVVNVRAVGTGVARLTMQNLGALTVFVSGAFVIDAVVL